MNDDFDLSAAVDTIGADLGFGDGEASEGAVESEDIGEVSESPQSETGETLAALETPVTEEAVIEAPKSWRKEAAAEFAKLSPVIRDEITKREDDIFKGIEGYKADASFGKTINNVLAPFMPTLQQYNIDPVAQISGLMQAHFTLATGSTEQKLELFQRIAADYGVDLSGLGGEAPYTDPQVKALQTKLDALESKTRGFEEASASQQRGVLEGQVKTFAENPANIHFKDLTQPMAALLKSGAATSLEDAYEKALWQNPLTRAKEIERQQAEITRKQQEEAKAKVSASRKATSTNVKTTAKSASAATPLGTIDDTLEQALNAIRSRV